jgi:predicted DNA-binding transcriptional regulator AlpA
MSDDDILSKYRTRKQLAAKLGVAELTLIRWEQDGKGPPPVRIGRSVYYSISGTQRWLVSLEDAAAA